jgi:TonB-linked SusC/RagA family outer membrane protein
MVKLILFLFGLLNLQAAGLTQTITLSGKNLPITTVFMEIKKQTGYVVVSSYELINKATPCTVSARNQPIEEFLKVIVSDQPFDFSIENKTIFISQRATPSPAGQVNIFSPPPVELTGRVVDVRGQPLAGATIQVKNTNKVATADENGNFSIDASPNDIVVVSYTGYEKREIAVGGKSSLEVVMKVFVSPLNDVVVVGYSTQRRADVTGSVASVKAKDIVNLPATDLATALQGRVPGAYITQIDGNPTSGSSVIIRGPLSINGGDPLYVVDGVPFQGTGLNFNIQDIESIDVLKDASAAAIYGYRAAGGVILIRTKRGTSGRVKVGVNSSVGMRQVFGLPKTLRRDEYIAAKKAFGFNVEDLYGPPSGWSSLPNTDWFKEIYRTGIENNHTLYVSGGTEKSNFYMSGNYAKIQGTRVGNSVDRYTFRINSEHKIGKRIKIGETLYGSFTNEDPDRSTNQGDLSFRHTPIMQPYDPSNSIGGWGKTPKGFGGGNDLASALGNYERNQNYEVLLTLNGEAEIANGLTLRAVFGTGLYGANNYFYQGAADLGANYVIESFNKYLKTGQNFIATYTLNYAKTFGQHAVKALAGYEARRANFSDLYGANQNPLVPRPQNFNLVQSVTSAELRGSNANVYDRVLSQFGRVEYNYGNKYLLTGTIRRDGLASKFGPNNRYGVFPGISAGWRISEEDFMNPITAISSLKLRAGYGLLGNSVGPDFAFSPAYGTGFTYDFGEGNGSGRRNSVNIINRLPNPNIKWESVATTNIGLDLGLLNNKLLVTLDYYDRQTKDMIYNVGIAPSVGLGSRVPANIGRMSNKGFEFNIEYNNTIKKDFTYGIAFNGATNKNRLISLDPAIDKLFLYWGELNEAYDYAITSRSEPGRELSNFYGYEVLGIYQDDGGGGAKRPTINGGYIPVAGDLIYRDINGDGEINDDDRTYIGSPWPKLVYGVNLKLGWKSLDFTAFFNGVYGNKIYNAFETFEHIFYGDYTTTSKIFETSGFNGNGVTGVPRVGKLDDYDQNRNWQSLNSYHVQNGSYLRLRNVQLGYNLQPAMLNRLHISSFRVFASATNLFTITKYKGINPDLGEGSFLDKGIDNANYRYPVSRIFSLGINAEF